MPGMTFLGEPDPVLGWDGQHAYATDDVAAGRASPAHLDGIASAVQFLGRGGARIFRDRLGLGKLFWGRREDDTLIFAARPAHLVHAGYAFDDIMALPRGRIVTLNEHGRPVSDVKATSTEAKQTFEVSLAEIGAQIRQFLDSYLCAIAAACPGRRVYLCLSGGLDSSTVSTS
ncbi:hypothetical protein KEU06_26355 [Pseudaminobacter sp. 19-2017]|uniref:Asparagine synthetase domain-containing protein n=1 Tax=Pseudaminobacter soli (ex Zhang et al. 2022) TaxID=2831468 RepID=A0A942E808_9HYPH|nr:hypothetical protein [Pseudaminobacter soli]MBS3652125.1 hypothetical protein [Pseudaminobacter soli]